MRLKRFTLLSIVSIFIFTALIAGCTPAQRPTVDPDRNTARDTIPNTNRDTIPDTNDLDRDTTPLRPDTTDENIDNNRNNNANNNANNNTTAVRAMEKRVADEVAKVPGVKNATVLINNNTAYIGIDLDEAIEDRQINIVKDRIINKVKDMENRITMVYVSADVDVVGRLRGYAQDIREGKPISGIFEELEDMFRRTVPKS